MICKETYSELVSTFFLDRTHFQRGLQALYLALQIHVSQLLALLKTRRENKWRRFLDTGSWDLEEYLYRVLLTVRGADNNGGSIAGNNEKKQDCWISRWFTVLTESAHLAEHGSLAARK